MAEENKAYAVGYKKPPEGTRFKPGQSGNPRGGRKGYRHVKTDLMTELGKKIPITENGISRKLTTQQLILKQVCRKAIGGDMASARLAAEFMLRYLGQEQEDSGKKETLASDDQEILDYYTKNRESI